MSTANEITRLGNAKSAIAAAITEKGVTVPSATKLDGMAALIGQIQQGGGAEMVTGDVNSIGYVSILFINESEESETIWGNSTLTCPKNSFLIVDNAPFDSADTSNCSLIMSCAVGSGDMNNNLLVFQVTGNNFSIWV